MANSVALVALDGSATAEYVLPWARTFARDAGLSLVLARLVSDVDISPALADAEVTTARHYLDGVAGALRAAGVEAEARTFTSGKNIAGGITGAAHEVQAELIIMATHGRSGVRRLVLGSVANEVIQTSPIAVLVVTAREERPEEHGRRVRRILLTLDGSKRAEQALPVATRYAGAFGAALDVVQVAPLAASLFAGSAESYVPENLDQQLEEAASAYLAGEQRRLAEGHCERGVRPARQPGGCHPQFRR